MVLAHSLARGRQAGFAFALGCTLGCMTHILWATLGVSAAVLASPTAFTALKWLGAAYLVWMAISAWRARPRPDGWREHQTPLVAGRLARFSGQRHQPEGGVVLSGIHASVHPPRLRPGHPANAHPRRHLHGADHRRLRLDCRAGGTHRSMDAEASTNGALARPLRQPRFPRPGCKTGRRLAFGLKRRKPTAG